MVVPTDKLHIRNMLLTWIVVMMLELCLFVRSLNERSAFCCSRQQAGGLQACQVFVLIGHRICMNLFALNDAHMASSHL